MYSVVKSAKKWKNLVHGGDSVIILCNWVLRKGHTEKAIYELMTDIDERAGHSDRYLVFQLREQQIQRP